MRRLFSPATEREFADAITARANQEVISLARQVARARLNAPQPAPPRPVVRFNFDPSAAPATPAAAVPQVSLFATRPTVTLPDALHDGEVLSRLKRRKDDSWQDRIRTCDYLFERQDRQPANRVPFITPENLVQQEMLRYEALQVDPGDLPPHRLLQFWREHAQDFPILSTVARSVLGYPVSAAAIERDFSVAGQLLTSRRSRLNSACVQMALFLKINATAVEQLYLPEVELLAPAQVQQRWPRRFRGEMMRNSMNITSFSERAAVFDGSDDESDTHPEA